jgi:hypothetical protein
MSQANKVLGLIQFLLGAHALAEIPLIFLIMKGKERLIPGAQFSFGMLPMSDSHKAAFIWISLATMIVRLHCAFDLRNRSLYRVTLWYDSLLSLILVLARFIFVCAHNRLYIIELVFIGMGIRNTVPSWDAFLSKENSESFGMLTSVAIVPILMVACYRLALSPEAQVLAVPPAASARQGEKQD